MPVGYYPSKLALSGMMLYGLFYLLRALYFHVPEDKWYPKWWVLFRSVYGQGHSCSVGVYLGVIQFFRRIFS